ncbi:MAG: helix-turn-helix domain-containing protein [Acidobacteriota bacterium]
MSKLHSSIVLDCSGLSLQDAAKLCNMSCTDFRRKFQAATQLTFHRFLILLRFLRAVELLNYSDLPITQIAFASGFDSLGALEYAFKKFLRSCPSQCRSCARTAHKICEKMSIS